MEVQQPGHPPDQEQLCAFLLCRAGPREPSPEAEGVKRTMWRLLVNLLGPAEPEPEQFGPVYSIPSQISHKLVLPISCWCWIKKAICALHSVSLMEAHSAP